MRKSFKMLSLLLAAVLLFANVNFALAEEKVITIPHYKTGENVGAHFFMPQVERFNKLYEGKYQINLEELTQDLYNDKMKQLGQQNALPALVEGGETEWIRNVVMPNGLFTDMTEFVNKNEAVKKVLIDSTLTYNTTEDGKLFSLIVPVVRPIGLFYNADMITVDKKLGEMTGWDEFVKYLGDTKVAFMTGENAWTTQLTLSGLIAKEEGGAALLQNSTVNKIYDFTQEPIVKAVEKLQTLLQKHAASNTVGAVYADAANAFMSKSASVIPNGSWMVSEFDAASKDKWSNGFDGATVRGDVLPGNVALANTNGFGWWIPSTVSADEREVAEAFLAFMLTQEELEAYMLAEGGVAPGLTTSEEFNIKSKENPLMYEYVNAVNAETVLVPNFGDCVPASISDTEFGKNLPLLIDGTWTAEEFCKQLTTLAEETKLNQ